MCEVLGLTPCTHTKIMNIEVGNMCDGQSHEKSGGRGEQAGTKLSF